MGLQNLYNMENLKNKSAELVYERIERLIEERDDFCKCPICILDLAAYTLNHVTPQYYTSLLGGLHPNRVKQKRIQVEIDLAIETGMKRINTHPHHDEETVSEEEYSDINHKGTEI